MTGELQRPRIGRGAAILDAQGRLLCWSSASRTPRRDHWGAPGGKLDWCEAARTCAEREIHEELGLDHQGRPCPRGHRHGRAGLSLGGDHLCRRKLGRRAGNPGSPCDPRVGLVSPWTPCPRRSRRRRGTLWRP
ncbi:NUDIX domain-containing protein [Caulobacter segnis]